MIIYLVLPFVYVVACMLLACEPQITTTCPECEFSEFDYSESLSIISGFDTTRTLIEQPYSDWEIQDSIETSKVIFSEWPAPDSTVILRFKIEAGAEDARTTHETGYDGEKFRVWYGSASRRYFKGKSAADSPLPPYFRIKAIEVLTPYQKDTEVNFNVKIPS